MWIFTHFFAPEPVFGIFPLIFEHNPRDFQAWSAEKYWALVYDDKKSAFAPLRFTESAMAPRASLEASPRGSRMYSARCGALRPGMRRLSVAARSAMRQLQARGAHLESDHPVGGLSCSGGRGDRCPIFLRVFAES